MNIYIYVCVYEYIYIYAFMFFRSKFGSSYKPIRRCHSIILRPTCVPSLLYGIADMASRLPRLIILLYNPNGGSGVPPIICKGPRGPSPTVGGSPQGPRCMWWGSPHYLQGSPGTLANCRGFPARSSLRVVGFAPLGSPLGLSGENSSQSDQTGNYFS